MSLHVFVILLLNVFLTSFVYAQYGSNFGNSNPGYGGTSISVSSGDYGHTGQNPVGGPSGSDGNSEPEPFNFAYQVKDAPTNTDFKHEANSDGKRVTGEYSVLLPNGRNQVVTYVDDENGYNAKINYKGEAKPQPSQPDIQGGYPSLPRLPPPSPRGGYSSAPRLASYSATSSIFFGSSGESLPAPSYLVQIPSYQNGVKGTSQPKTGDFDYVL
ncbi:hypothetical protein QTP88_020782 [Uroleucon formosanum]